MSSELLAWSVHVNVKPSSAKHLLMILCDHANPNTGRIFPSIPRLVAFTGQNEKTVVAGLQRLIEKRLLIDMGERTGKRGTTRVFRVNRDWGGPMVPKTGVVDRATTPKNGGYDNPQKRGPEPSSKEPRNLESPLPPAGEEGGRDQVVVESDLFGQPIIDPAVMFESAVVEAFEKGWTAHASRYPRVPGLRLPMSDRKRGALLARVREWYSGQSPVEGVNVVTKLFERLDGSPFLCGEVKDWAAPVDWVLGPENFEKTMERRNERDLASNNGPTGAGASSVAAGNRALALLRDGGRRS